MAGMSASYLLQFNELQDTGAAKATATAILGSAAMGDTRIALQPQYTNDLTLRAAVICRWGPTHCSR